MKTLILAIAFIFSFNAYCVTDSVGVFSQGDYAISTTSTKIIESNAIRKYLLIQNKGSNAVYVKFGGANSGLDGIKIEAGGSYEPSKCPTSSIYVETESGSSTVDIMEGI